MEEYVVMHLVYRMQCNTSVLYIDMSKNNYIKDLEKQDEEKEKIKLIEILK